MRVHSFSETEHLNLENWLSIEVNKQGDAGASEQLGLFWWCDITRGGRTDGVGVLLLGQELEKVRLIIDRFMFW